MFEYVLDCPRCKNRFNYELQEGSLPETISCPGCGEESPVEDYYAVVLCSQCRAKLKMPLDMVNEEGNTCPKCGAGIRNDGLSALGEEGTTIADFVPSGEKKKLLQDGAFFDKFRIIKLLGRGGMAEVYLAEHLLLKQRCALKLMQRTLEQDDNPVFIKRFVREAKLTHSLNHPNIVKVFDAGSDFKTGYLFLAMEYVEGKTLHDIIREKVMSEDELLEVLRIMCDALKVLESAKVVHRDLKPSNIMYTKEGVYKLMDLGIAKMESNHQAGDMTLTMEQSTIGTPGYASPEQCSAAHLVDSRSDIFSLGATLYHAATGQVPFTGDTPMAALLNTMQKDPEPLRDHRPDLSDGFIEMIEKMMKKKPSERYQTMDEILQAAEKIEKNKSQSLPARKIKAAVSALTTVFSNRKKDEEAPKKKPFFARFVLGIFKLVLGVALLLVAAVHVYYVLSRMEQKNPIPYKEFMKSLIAQRLQVEEEKAEERVKESPESRIAERIARSHKLVPVPGEELRPENGRYTAIRITEPLQHGMWQHKFDTLSAGMNNISPEMLKEGCVEILKGEKVFFANTQGGFTEEWSIFLNLQLMDENPAGLFSFHGFEAFTYNKTLWIFLNDHYADTQIHIPAEKWVNLTFSVDRKAGRIDLLSEELLLGSWLFPGMNSHVYTNFAFSAAGLPMRGKIDFATGFRQSLKIVPHKPLTRRAFAPRDERYPDETYLRKFLLRKPGKNTNPARSKTRRGHNTGKEGVTQQFTSGIAR